MKPCPFCGSKVSMKVSNENEIDYVDSDCEKQNPYWTVVCSVNNGGCGAMGGYRPSKKQAISSWDRRAER